MRLPAFLLALACLSMKASAQVVINEVGIAPVGNGEFIELFNRNGCAVDLGCYTLVFSSTSGGGNPTGWTIKIPSGKTISAGGYFLIGGMAGAAGVFGSGYPTGGAAIPYPAAADVDVGTLSLTANAVYMKQSLNAGNLPNSGGQLTLLNASGGVVGTVSYNSGNNSGSYPLSAYTTCNATGNTQGNNNIANPGTATNNVNATFTSATIQGIYLNTSGTYQTETSLSPRAANTANGGTQLCSGPVLNTVNALSCCFNSVSQALPLVYIAVNSPTFYSISWNALPVNSFSVVSNAAISGNGISITVPANTPPGIYTGSLQLSNTCGQSCTQNFTVTVSGLPVVSAGNYPPLCINSGPVVLNGSPVGGAFSGTGVAGNNLIPTSSGSFTITYSYTDAATGCTNTATTPVIVSVPASNYGVACSTVSPYLFYGQTITASGLYSALVPNANGCTDTAKLYLTLNKTVVIDSTGCDSVLYEGIAYHNSTSFNQTVQSVVSGCDSVTKNIRIHVNQSKVKDTSVCLGPGAGFSTLGQNFTTSGNYILHTRTTAGCDSLIRLHLTIATTELIDTSVCNMMMYHGASYIVDTTILETIAATNGCDSILRTVHIRIKQSSHSLTLGCAGVGQSYLFNGQSYSTSGLHTVHLTNAAGCDSAAQLYLTITQTSAVTLQSCTSVVYNGTGYNTSTIIYDTIRSEVTACDSLIKKAVITISPQLHTTTSVCAQEGDVIPFHGQTITTSGWYTAQLTASSGCDSIVNLYIVFKKLITQTLTVCDSIFYTSIWYHQSILINDTSRSVISGCDSIVKQTNLIIKPSRKVTVYACANDGATYLFNGVPLVSSGWYAAHHTSVDGCDSLVNLYIVFTKTQTQTFTGCDSLFTNNHVYHQPVIERDTVRSIVSLCDSLIHIKNIIINSSKAVYLNACSSTGNYMFFGQTLISSGFYTHTLSTANSCDSIIHLYLVVTSVLNQTITGCDSVLYKSHKYYYSTSISDTVRSNVTGCDSIIHQVQITVGHTIHTTASLCLGPGQTYNFNGQLLNTSGTYTTTYTNACDSIVTLHLIIAKQQAGNISGCDSVLWKGIHYTASTYLHDTIRSVITSCDSIYLVTTINVLHRSVNYTTACIKEGDAYSFAVQALTTPGHYSTIYSLPGRCDSVVNLYLVVTRSKVAVHSGCDSVLYNGVYYTSSIQLRDTIRSLITSCDSIINIATIQVNQKPSITVSANITICKGDSTQLIASSPSAIINWTGFTPGDTVWVKPATTSNYSVMATDTNGCSNSNAVTVFVQDFTVAILASPPAALTGQSIVLQTTSAWPYSVTSWMPSGMFINQRSKSQRLLADSSLRISVTAESDIGCRDTAFVSLLITPLDDVYVPSAFTPNSDGKNDVVSVVSSAIKEMDFKIFNRWGQMVFYTKDKYKSWDGKFRGLLQPAGTYVYIVKVKKVDGKTVEKKGTITLIR